MATARPLLIESHVDVPSMDDPWIIVEQQRLEIENLKSMLNARAQARQPNVRIPRVRRLVLATTVAASAVFGGSVALAGANGSHFTQGCYERTAAGTCVDPNDSLTWGANDSNAVRIVRLHV